MVAAQGVSPKIVTMMVGSALMKAVTTRKANNVMQEMRVYDGYLVWLDLA